MRRSEQRYENRCADKVANHRAAHKPREEAQCGAKDTPLRRGLRSSAPHPRKTKTPKEPRNANSDHRFHQPIPCTAQKRNAAPTPSQISLSLLQPLSGQRTIGKRNTPIAKISANPSQALSSIAGNTTIPGVEIQVATQ